MSYMQFSQQIWYFGHFLQHTLYSVMLLMLLKYITVVSTAAMMYLNLS